MVPPTICSVREGVANFPYLARRPFRQICRIGVVPVLFVWKGRHTSIAPICCGRSSTTESTGLFGALRQTCRRPPSPASSVALALVGGRASPNHRASLPGSGKFSLTGESLCRVQLSGRVSTMSGPLGCGGASTSYPPAPSRVGNFPEVLPECSGR